MATDDRDTDERGEQAGDPDERRVRDGGSSDTYVNAGRESTDAGREPTDRPRQQARGNQQGRGQSRESPGPTDSDQTGPDRRYGSRPPGGATGGSAPPAEGSTPGESRTMAGEERPKRTQPVREPSEQSRSLEETGREGRGQPDSRGRSGSRNERGGRGAPGERGAPGDREGPAGRGGREEPIGRGEREERSRPGESGQSDAQGREADDPDLPKYGGRLDPNWERKRGSSAERERTQREYERRFDKQFDRQRDFQVEKGGGRYRRR